MSQSETLQSTSLMSGLIDIYVDPKKALSAADERSGWTMLPLALVLMVPAVMVAYYFQTVDFNWFIDQMAAASPEEFPEEAREFLSPTVMMTTGVIGATISGLVGVVLNGLYLHFLAKITTTDSRKYSAWFRLAVWAAMPAAIIGVLAALLNYMLAGTNQVGLDDLAFYSVNSLFTHIPMGQPGASVMNALTPFTLWTVALTGTGLHLWTGRTMGKSLILAAIPAIIVYSVWSVVSFG